MSKTQRATLAAGCFWCSQAIFKRLKGIVSVIAGYCGGQPSNPNYEAVSTGTTGHAEAIQVTFDPEKISYQKILDVFWHLHDPTTLNRQGADVGPQYRSVIFYHDQKQKEIAAKSKEKVGKSGLYKKPIVTEISPLKSFFKAESYHQDFYDKNRGDSYCRLIIDPKIQKSLSQFRREVRED